MSMPTAKSNDKKQPALASERAHPGELRDQRFESPVIRRRREQIVRLIVENGAGIGAQERDVVLSKPALHFADGVRVLLGMLILIAQPRLASPDQYQHPAENS